MSDITKEALLEIGFKDLSLESDLHSEMFYKSGAMSINIMIWEHPDLETTIEFVYDCNEIYTNAETLEDIDHLIRLFS